MSQIPLQEVIRHWRLPTDGPLLDRIEQMIRPALLQGYFGASFTRFVCGLQYHLGGAQDTTELAHLAALTATDRVLDVCCFVGGPAIQLAESVHCQVAGLDRAAPMIRAAQQIARLAGLTERAWFLVADAGVLPFQDRRFTVVWNQQSLEHSEEWLYECDRVLEPGGRLALTFEILKPASPVQTARRRWTLEEVVRQVQALGYRVTHAEEITDRDIEIGWQALAQKLSIQEREFAAVLGAEWVRQAQQEFAQEIEAMRQGHWGSGRLVAIKTRPA